MKKTPVPLVALIDDDTFYSRMYADPIEELTGAQVRLFDGPREFIEAVNAGAQFDVIITDVMMMADGTFSEEESHHGILTGLLLVDAIREAGILCPIIILTNSSATRMEWINSKATADGGIHHFQKPMCSPRVFATEVGYLLRRAAGLPTTADAWGRFLDSIQLRPTFMGLGIDLKELIKKRKR